MAETPNATTDKRVKRRPLRVRDWAGGLFVAWQIWLWSRQRIVLTICSFLLLVAIIVVQFLATRTPDWEIAQRYQKRAQQAFQDEQWDAANLYFQRCLWIKPWDTKSKLNLALIAEKQEDQSRAWALMSQIAPLDATGEPLAHFWLAQKILSRETSLDDHALQAAQIHLTRAVETMPGNLQAREMLAKVHVRLGQTEKAAAQFQVIAHSIPQAYLTLAALYRRENMTTFATTAAENAVAAFERQIEDTPQNVQARNALATAHVMLEDEEAAAQVLQEGLALSSEPALQLSLANLYLLRYRKLLEDDQARFEDKLQLLSAALNLVPQHTGAMAMLAALTAGDSQDAQEARRRLKQALAEGKAPAIIHLILGTNAFDEGNLAEAELHFRQAMDLSPAMPAIVNNLAWVLFQTDPANADRALDLVNRAIELAPQHPECRASRGVILLHKGQPREAILDLERALNQYPKRVDLHAALADAYEQVGDAELAAEHRKFVPPQPSPQTPTTPADD